jgi:hypothetical protein
VLEFIIWAALAGSITPITRWRITYEAWDFATWRTTMDLTGYHAKRDWEEIEEAQAESRTPLDWIIAFLVTELIALGVLFGSPFGEQARTWTCGSIAGVPLHALMCPAQPSWL